MHPNVGFTFEQRPLNPPYEPRLVAKLTAGCDLDQLRPSEHLGNLPSLGFRQCAPACSNSQRQVGSRRRSSVTLLAPSLSGSVSTSSPNSSRKALT